MARDLQTFIPKKANSTTSRKSSLGIFSLLAWVVFVLALLSVVGVFAYEKVIESSIERKRESLERARAAFEPTLIEELARLDERLRFAQGVIDNHRAPSQLFDLLEDLTVQNVRFETFGYRDTDTGISISMNGEARSFNAIAVQADIFAENNIFQSPIFSGLNLDQVGNVDFSFSGILRGDVVQYVSRVVADIGNDTIESIFDIDTSLEEDATMGSELSTSSPESDLEPEEQ